MVKNILRKKYTGIIGRKFGNNRIEESKEEGQEESSGANPEGKEMEVQEDPFAASDSTIELCASVTISCLLPLWFPMNMVLFH